MIGRGAKRNLTLQTNMNICNKNAYYYLNGKYHRVYPKTNAKEILAGIFFVLTMFEALAITSLISQI